MKFSKRKPKSFKPKRMKKHLASKLSGPMKPFSQVIPFPRKWNCKFRYTDTLTLTTGSGGVFGTTYSYGLNCLYDPYLGTGGHQPYGFDQMTALYARYHVSGCLVELVINDPSSDGIVVGCLVQSSTGIGSIANQTTAIIKEQPYSWVCPLNNTGSQVKKFKQYFPMHVVEGLTKMQYHCDLTGYASVISANPTNKPDIEIGACSDRASAGDTIKCHITLTYFTQLYDPILQAQS